MCCDALQCVAVCCSVLQCELGALAAGICMVSDNVCCSVFCMCCSVVWCVAVRCYVLLCVAVCAGRAGCRDLCDHGDSVC